jgi:hypothetical protein
VPEHRGAQLDDVKRTVELLGAALGSRLGRTLDDLKVRIFTGALSVVVAVVLGEDVHYPPDGADVSRAIDYLRTGFPLMTSAQPAKTPRRR